MLFWLYDASKIIPSHNIYGKVSLYGYFYVILLKGRMTCGIQANIHIVKPNTTNKS